MADIPQEIEAQIAAVKTATAHTLVRFDCRDQQVQTLLDHDQACDVPMFVVKASGPSDIHKQNGHQLAAALQFEIQASPLAD